MDFVWGIYDSTNEGVDAFYLGDLLRALELNPTQATIEKLGGTKKKGKDRFSQSWKATVSDIKPIVKPCAGSV